MLRIGNAPISESQLVIGEDLKTTAGKVSLVLGVEDKAEPQIVDELKGFEFVID